MGRKGRNELLDSQGRTFVDRLKEALRYAKLADDKPSPLAQKLGIDRRIVHNWLKNETIPEVEFIFRIARVLGVDAEWLVTGDGEMAPLVLHITSTDREAVKLVRRLPDDTRQQWINEGYRLEEESLKQDALSESIISEARITSKQDSRRTLNVSTKGRRTPHRS